MTKNPHSSFLLGPAAITIHDHSDVLRKVIEVDMFLKGGHKGCKISKKGWA
jgi:hypothetical protein